MRSVIFPIEDYRDGKGGTHAERRRAERSSACGLGIRPRSTAHAVMARRCDCPRVPPNRLSTVYPVLFGVLCITSRNRQCTTYSRRWTTPQRRVVSEQAGAAVEP